MERHSKIASNFICLDTLHRAKALEAREWRAAAVFVPKHRRENVDWKISTDTCHLQLNLCYLILHIRNFVRRAENIFSSLFLLWRRICWCLNLWQRVNNRISMSVILYSLEMLHVATATTQQRMSFALAIRRTHLLAKSSMQMMPCAHDLNLASK